MQRAMVLVGAVCVIILLPWKGWASGDTPNGSNSAQHAVVGSSTGCRVDVAFAVPKAKEPAFHIPPGHVFQTDSVWVAVSDGSASLVASGGDSVGPGEYKLLADGTLRFSPADAKRKIIISYSYRPTKVAMLPVVNQSNLSYMPAAAAVPLTECLSKLGFLTLSGSDVSSAVRSEGVNFDAVLTGVGEQPSASEIAALASRIGADYLVLCTVGAGSEGGQKGVLQTGATVSSYRTREMVTVSVCLLLYDGCTGKNLFTKMKADKARPILGNHRTGRERIARVMVEGILSEYFTWDF